MQGTLLASYLVSAFLLLLLSYTGAVESAVPWGYAGAGIFSCGGFGILLGSGWSERFDDRFLIMPQTVANVAINLAFIAWVPQIGILLLLVLFTIFAFGSLRMSGRHVLAVAMAIAVVVAVMIALIGERFSLPMATWQQRAVCGLWFALTLARGAILGTYGDQLRKQLAVRNAELAATFEKLELLASRDALTDTFNRRRCMELLEEERQRMARTGQRFGVVLFDIDHFKKVNDGYGHLVGDEVLRRFSSATKATMRDTDRLARYGGEEFLLLQTATGEASSAMAGAERIRRAVAAHDWAQLTPGLAVTVSAGVAISLADESLEQLLGRADAALYEAKRNGRNCVRTG
jgi:diguanylate cyclase (GGDEF)-like protein